MNIRQYAKLSSAAGGRVVTVKAVQPYGSFQTGARGEVPGLEFDVLAPASYGFRTRRVPLLSASAGRTLPLELRSLFIYMHMYMYM